MDEKVSVVVPAYNEENTILETIEGMIHDPMIGEIIVVDDGSKDCTYEKVSALHHPKLILVSMGHNHGKGAALRKGITYCRYPIIGFIDGDVGQTSKEIKKLISPICEKNADVCIAQFPKVSKRAGFGIVKWIARKGVFWYTGSKIDSVLSGQRTFRRDVLNKIYISDGYGAEVGMTIDILKNNFSICEIPVKMVHKETERTIKGFIHRGKECYDIIRVLIQKN